MYVFVSMTLAYLLFYDHIFRTDQFLDIRPFFVEQYYTFYNYLPIKLMVAWFYFIFTLYFYFLIFWES